MARVNAVNEVILRVKGNRRYAWLATACSDVVTPYSVAQLRGHLLPHHRHQLGAVVVVEALGGNGRRKWRSTTPGLIQNEPLGITSRAPWTTVGTIGDWTGDGEDERALLEGTQMVVAAPRALGTDDDRRLPCTYDAAALSYDLNACLRLSRSRKTMPTASAAKPNSGMRRSSVLATKLHHGTAAASGKMSNQLTWLEM